MASCLLFRLTPGDDLFLGMEQFIARNNIRSAAIITCVGSLSKAMIRFADQQDGMSRHWKDRFKLYPW
ncbi:PPC domain-containing DNA-binding protein [Kistimonas scapharcae]|uniref:PPC domain-containing DNA-binding protein n=1 Tax=Kistimonas scapharcae TaxID=1036133 RepID=UPI0031EDFD8E